MPKIRSYSSTSLIFSGSLERRKILDDLRKKGSFEWNTNSTLNNGLLLTSRRPNWKYFKTASDYMTCFSCLGTYSITNLRHHVKICTANALNGERIVMKLSRIVESRIHQRACYKLKTDIFPIMQEDDIVRIIRFDWLIIIYGNMLCIKHTDVFNEDLIRSKLRLAGRLLLEIKSFSVGVTDFASIFDSELYDPLVNAIRLVGKFDYSTNHYNSPSTSAAAVTEIRDISKVLIGEYIRKKNFDGIRETELFIKLMDTEISVTINKGVINSQAMMKREKTERLPTTQDIKLLAAYADREKNRYFSQLQKGFTLECWRKLSEMTMVSLMIFNRRRVGDIQNIKVIEFEHREFLGGDLFLSLSEKDKKIAQRYARMKVRGKLGRTVPVLIKPDILQCLQLIISHRKDAGIQDGNIFLFALPTKMGTRVKVINAGTVICKLSVLCGAKDPKTLRGTMIRKHLASTCISMELDDNAVAEVADFMGHSEKVHRDHYRRNPMSREVVQMSQLLEAALGNCDEMSDTESDSVNEISITENVIVSDTNITHSPMSAEGNLPATGLKRKRKQSPDEHGRKCES